MSITNIPLKTFISLLSSVVILSPFVSSFTTTSGISFIKSPKTTIFNPPHDYRHRRRSFASSTDEDDIVTEAKPNDDTTILTMTSSSSPNDEEEGQKEQTYYPTTSTKIPPLNHELFEQHPASTSSELVLTSADVNGDYDDIKLENETDVIPLKPAMSFSKFLTMQDKRVVVTVRYSEALKSFFLTTAKKIKEKHPHVVLEKRILPFVGGDDKMVFEVLVDGKICIGKRRMKKLNSSSGGGSAGGGGGEQQQQPPPYHDTTGGRSVYISMDDLDVAIGKARRRRRPSTYYGRNTLPNEKTSAAMRLEMLRKHKSEKAHTHEVWADD